MGDDTAGGALLPVLLLVLLLLLRVLDPTGVPVRTDDVDEAVEPAEHGHLGALVEAGYRGFAPEALVIGGVESAAEQLRALAAAGYSDVIVRNLMASQPHALGSIERLGRVRELVADV